MSSPVSCATVAGKPCCLRSEHRYLAFLHSRVSHCCQLRIKCSSHYGRSVIALCVLSAGNFVRIAAGCVEILDTRSAHFCSLRFDLHLAMSGCAILQGYCRLQCRKHSDGASMQKAVRTCY